MSRRPGIDRSAAALDALGDDERLQLYSRLHSSGAATSAVEALSPVELAREASAHGIALATQADEASLRTAVLHHRAAREGMFWASGLCDLQPDGFGFLRAAGADFAAGPADVYVSGNQLLHLGLRTGHLVEGPARPPRSGERHAALLRVENVGGRPLAVHLRTPPFEAQPAIVPYAPLPLATANAPLAVRAVTRLLPIAHGHRILCVVEDPRLPRPALLAAIARAALAADPELLVHACLLDATAEDRASLAAANPGGALAVAPFDAAPSRQTEVADLSLARAQRAAEAGRRVLCLLDSLPALWRHGCETVPRGDHRLADGARPADQRVKRAFTLARQLEGGGALTLLATLPATDHDGHAWELFASLLRRASGTLVFADDGTGLPDPVRTVPAPVDLAFDPARLQPASALRAALAAVPCAQRAARWPELLDDPR